MLLNTDAMLKMAKENHCAIPAPDFWDSNSADTFVKTAESLGNPIILSFAEAHLDRLDLEEAYHIGSFYAKRASVPVALHLDHGIHTDIVMKAIDLGFTSVMIDASSESFEENIRRTKEVAAYAHQKNVTVEAELGHVGNEDKTIPSKLNETVYTDPVQAEEFVKRSSCDSLAVSIGTSHGAYKNGTPHINFDILSSISSSVSVPLVLHGGSGTGDDNLSRCALGGICKVNIFTDFILAAMHSLQSDPSESWYQLLDHSDRAIHDVLVHYYGILYKKP